jgi:hypothetical protein
MNNKKQFDCVEFKHELHRAAYKKSGATSLKEYIAYVNSEVEKSDLHKKQVSKVSKI